jgi:uncharacterized protein
MNRLMPKTSPAADSHPPMPWWKFKMVWLVVGGPAVVVVAGITTAIIAINGADTLVDTGPRTTAPSATTPAVQARNHAATPAVPAKP